MLGSNARLFAVFKFRRLSALYDVEMCEKVALILCVHDDDRECVGHRPLFLLAVLATPCFVLRKLQQALHKLLANGPRTATPACVRH